MKLKSIKDIKNLKSKRIIVRVGFNVPLNKNKIIDDRKIQSVLPTINYLIEKNAKVILISHLGRPDKNQKSKIKNQNNGLHFKINKDEEFSLKPIAKRLEKLLNKKVKFISDCVGEKVEKEISKMKDKEIILLENLRFYKEEEKNSKIFAKSLSKFGDIYINEAFSVSHRNHASVSAITKFLPSFAGFLLEAEVFNLLKQLKNPQRPYIILLGGAKLSTKIKLIEILGKKADKILIGGAIANVFLKAKGYEIGKSLAEKNMIIQAKAMLKKRNLSKKFLLPTDVVIGKSINKAERVELKKVEGIQNNDIILDIGVETVYAYSQILKKAKTILWNGPMGKFEFKQFSHGSLMLARVIASVSSDRVFSVCGGGETAEILDLTKMEKFVSWVSTGGGAMLSFLANEEMPGIEPLKELKVKSN
ncbi:MAG: phosphoglycerate kinase [Patescibacteria group bacterium]|nr:phosphoglycerate kinase [Patescibacteria group bacterium]